MNDHEHTRSTIQSQDVGCRQCHDLAGGVSLVVSLRDSVSLGTGARREAGAARPEARRMPMSLITDLDLRLAKDEIFGPLPRVIRHDDLDSGSRLSTRASARSAFTCSVRMRC